MKSLITFIAATFICFSSLTADQTLIQKQDNGSELLYWIHSPSTEASQLSAKVILEDHLPVACQTFDYNQYGQMVATTLHGDLSGNHKTILDIDENGRPQNCQTEQYSRYWHYDPNDPALLLSVSEDNGTTTTYQYDSCSKRVAAELTCDSSNCHKRRFFTYNPEGKLTSLIVDDSSHSDFSELKDATFRYETTFSYYPEGPNAGRLKELQEKRFSFATKQWQTLKHVENRYDEQGNLLEQHDLKPPHYALYNSKSTSIQDYAYEAWYGFMHAIFDKSFLQFSGFYQGITTSGVFLPGQEINDNVRVTLINGILNISADMEVILQKISKTHGDITVHYVFRPTEGWTKDLLNCTLIKFGYVSEPAQLLAEKWKELINELGGVESGGSIVHYAHSIGATDTYTARNLLSCEEQKMIHVVTLGSPSLIPPDVGFGSVANYASKRDAICLLDPIGYIKGLASTQDNVYFLGSYWGLPEHTLYAESYNDTLKKLGQNFVVKYREKSLP